MSVSFRDGGVGDADAIDAVFRATFRSTFAHLYRSEDLEDFLKQFTNDAWSSELRDPNFAFRVAEAGKDVVGYVKLGPLKLPVERNGGAIEIRQFYVLPLHHGSGIASALMDWSLAEAARRAANNLFLTVFTDNHRACRFYGRYGFVPVGHYDFMVGNHADQDIIMKKVL